MKPHALLLVASLLGSPAWSQEPAPRSFDLGSESIRKIVRETAAKQSVALQVSEDATVERMPAVKTVVFVPPEKPPLLKDLPTRRAPPPAPRPNGFLDAALNTLVDTVVDTVFDDLVKEHATVWRPCETRADVPTATLNHSMCEQPSR
jgi:hypothetical protein